MAEASNRPSIIPAVLLYHAEMLASVLPQIKGEARKPIIFRWSPLRAAQRNTGLARG
jgi:hypothetical protein